MPDVAERKLQLTVVINGHPLEVSILPSWTVIELIYVACRSAGVQMRGTAWDLRSESGEKLGTTHRLRAVVKDGDTLYLDPQVGGGA